MSEHTKEPWIVAHGSEKMVIANNRTPAIAQTIGDDAIANARRIVACVNTCAGISTESLEQGGIGSLLSLGIDEQKRGDCAEHQRDKLLAALKYIANEVDGPACGIAIRAIEQAEKT